MLSIYLHVSFDMFKCTRIFIHTVLLEIHVRFHVLFYSNLSFLSPFFNFFSRSQIGKTLGLNWEKKILFCIGNGAEFRPQIRQIKSPDIPHASRSLLWIRFVAVAFQSEEKVCWRRGPRVTYFGPALDPPLGGSGWKTITLVRDHEHFIPTKFRKHPSSGTVVKADYVFPYIYMHQCTPPFFA